MYESQVNFSAKEEYEELFKFFRKDFSNYLNKAEFKQGSFKGLINEKTDPLVTLDILIESAKITNAERRKFKRTKHMYTVFKHSDLDKMNSKQYDNLIYIGQCYENVFRKDAGLPATKLEPRKFTGVDPWSGKLTTMTIGTDGKATQRWGADPDAMRVPDPLNTARGREAKRWVKEGRKEAKAQRVEEEKVRAKKKKRNVMERERKKRQKRRTKEGASGVQDSGDVASHESDDEGDTEDEEEEGGHGAGDL